MVSPMARRPAPHPPHTLHLPHHQPPAPLHLLINITSPPLHLPPHSPHPLTASQPLHCISNQHCHPTNTLTTASLPCHPHTHCIPFPPILFTPSLHLPFPSSPSFPILHRGSRPRVLTFSQIDSISNCLSSSAELPCSLPLPTPQELRGEGPGP